MSGRVGSPARDSAGADEHAQAETIGSRVMLLIGRRLDHLDLIPLQPKGDNATLDGRGLVRLRLMRPGISQVRGTNPPQTFVPLAHTGYSRVRGETWTGSPVVATGMLGVSTGPATGPATSADQNVCGRATTSLPAGAAPGLITLTGDVDFDQYHHL
jgi:hypothetical protein